MRTCRFPTSRAILPSRWGQRVPQCWKERSHFHSRDILKLHPRNNQARWIWRNLEVGMAYIKMSRNSTAKTKKKTQTHTQKTRQSLCLSSLGFPLYCIIGSPDTLTPPPTNQQGLCTQNFSSFQTEVYIVSWIHPTFLLDVYFPAFKMLPFLDAAHNVHLVHTNHIADLLKTLHLTFTTPDKEHNGR